LSKPREGERKKAYVGERKKRNICPGKGVGLTGKKLSNSGPAKKNIIKKRGGPGKKGTQLWKGGKNIESWMM